MNTIQAIVIPDRFYADYRTFVGKLKWINDNLMNIPDEPAHWEKELESIFAKHARYLIEKGPVTFDILNKAFEADDLSNAKNIVSQRAMAGAFWKDVKYSNAAEEAVSTENGNNQKSSSNDKTLEEDSTSNNFIFERS